MPDDVSLAKAAIIERSCQALGLRIVVKSSCE